MAYQRSTGYIARKRYWNCKLYSKLQSYETHVTVNVNCLFVGMNVIWWSLLVALYDMQVTLLPWHQMHQAHQAAIAVDLSYVKATIGTTWWPHVKIYMLQLGLCPQNKSFYRKLWVENIAVCRSSASINNVYPWQKKTTPGRNQMMTEIHFPVSISVHSRQ